MLRKLSAILLYMLFLLCSSAFTAAAPQNASDRFDLSGKVINAATGDPVSGALVELPGQYSQFSQSDGSFVFTNLPRGQFTVSARKPGFFNERQMGHWISEANYTTTIPADAEVLIKLQPEGIIFGQVKNENGDSMDGVMVRTHRWQVQDGRRQLQPAGETTTDDEGNFRIAELLPGNYYLSFLPADRGGRLFTTLRRKTKSEEAYALQFYPAGSDIASAGALEIHPGAQLHIAHTLTRQRTFEVSGIVRPAENFAPIMLVTPSGDAIQRIIRFNRKTGEFQIPGVPAGTYMLSVNALSRKSSDQPSDSDSVPLTASVPIHVQADLSGVLLNLGSAVTVAVQLHDETGRETAPNVQQVFVRMTPKDFPNSGGLGLSLPGNPRSPAQLTLAPGIYVVEAMPTMPGYVASLRCGNVDLLRDDLTIAPGSPPPPIEVTLRGDGAQITATLPAGVGTAGMVIYSEEYPRRSLQTLIFNANASVPNLAPGNYQVFAFTATSELEYRNPAAIEKYLKHAIPVTLQPGDNVSLHLEIQQPAESQP